MSTQSPGPAGMCCQTLCSQRLCETPRLLPPHGKPLGGSDTFTFLKARGIWEYLGMRWQTLWEAGEAGVNMVIFSEIGSCLLFEHSLLMNECLSYPVLPFVLNLSASELYECLKNLETQMRKITTSVPTQYVLTPFPSTYHL